MDPIDFLQAMDEALRVSLSEAGFRRTKAGVWNRRVGEVLNVIWIQQHSVKLDFSVNLGIHYAFMPKVGSSEKPVDDIIEQPECDIMLRLTSTPAVNDQWWLSSQSSISEICDLITTRAMEVFSWYDLPGPISEVDIEDVKAGNAGLLSRLTQERACLFMARMHLYLGNREKCIATANTGIQLSGKMASGLRANLKNVIKECESATR